MYTKFFFSGCPPFEGVYYSTVQYGDVTGTVSTSSTTFDDVAKKNELSIIAPAVRIVL